jgi:hypothetical protein
MNSVPEAIKQYHESGRPLICEMDENPFDCEFWSLDEIEQFNREYEVPKYAPGFFGFGTSGGGEMFALSPTGTVVCLPFIGMEPKVATQIAASWSDFERIIRGAL